MWNKFLEVLLVICIAVSLTNVTAFADVTSPGEAVDTVPVAVTARLVYNPGNKPAASASISNCTYGYFVETWSQLENNTIVRSWSSANPGGGEFSTFEQGKTYGYRITLYQVELTEPVKVTLNGVQLTAHANDGRTFTPYTFEYKAASKTLFISGPAITPTLDVIFPVEYKITQGAKGVWTKGSSAGLSFTADGNILKFVGVMVDGAYITEDCYTASSGSTIVTLKKWYLNKLPIGVHDLTIVFEDGTCGTQFGIKRGVSVDTNDVGITIPKTGDSSNLGLWAALMLVSAAVAIATVVIDRKKKYN